MLPGGLEEVWGGGGGSPQGKKLPRLGPLATWTYVGVFTRCDDMPARGLYVLNERFHVGVVCSKILHELVEADAVFAKCLLKRPCNHAWHVRRCNRHEVLDYVLCGA